MSIGMQAMPLDKEIKSGHGESQAGLEILPSSVGQAFEMANGGEHREHGFHDHTHVPGFGFADLQVLRISLFGVKAMVCQDNHLVFKGLDQGMKGCIMNIGSGTRPTTDQAFLVEQATDLAAHDPATIGVAFFANLSGAATFPARMQQFHAIAVHHTQHRGLGQKPLRPGAMGLEQTEQTGAFWQFGEPDQPIPLQPAIEGSIPDPLERKQDAQRYHFTRVLELTRFGGRW